MGSLSGLSPFLSSPVFLFHFPPAAAINSIFAPPSLSAMKLLADQGLNPHWGKETEKQAEASGAAMHPIKGERKGSPCGDVSLLLALRALLRYIVLQATWGSRKMTAKAILKQQCHLRGAEPHGVPTRESLHPGMERSPAGGRNF